MGKRTGFALVAGAALAILAGSAWWPRRQARLASLHIESGCIMAVPEGRGTSYPVAGRFTEISGVDVSYDGATIAFAARPSPSEPRRIYLVSSAGGDPQPISGTGTLDCSEPHFLSGGTLVFTAAQGGSNALYIYDLAARRSERITFNKEPLSRTTILPDGRILVQLGQRWCTVNTDGTGIAPYAGPPPRSNDAADLAVHPRKPPMGHVSVVDASRPTGKLFCLGVGISEEAAIRRAPPGSLAWVRVWIADPQERVLGTVPLASDASFSLELPADRPVRLDILNRQGAVVCRMPVWIWVRPNESRGCIGCHESPYLTPPNRVAEAIRKPPQKLMPSNGSAHQSALKRI
ncbi:MAG: hypothetical protein ACP5VE_06840 [Chthonomonadales bacterium]